MSGRGAGFCAGYGMPGYANRGPAAQTFQGGRGYWPNPGFGRGGGRGHRNWFHATGLTGWQRAGMGWQWPPVASYQGPTPEQELSMLRNEAKAMEAAVAETQDRIRELENEIGADEA